MNSGILFGAATGLSSGLWPILMKKSGLSPDYIPLAFGIGLLMVALPQALWGLASGTGLRGVHWPLLIAGMACGAGVLLNAGLMIRFTPHEALGVSMIVWAVVQVSVPAVYTAVLLGGIPSLHHALAYVFACVALVLLVTAPSLESLAASLGEK